MKVDTKQSYMAAAALLYKEQAPPLYYYTRAGAEGIINYKKDKK